MSIGPSILACMGIAAGVVGIATLLVFLAAGSANLSPEAALRMRRWMLGAVVAGLLALAGAIVAWISGRPMLGAGIGAAPAVFVVLAGVYLVITGS